MIKKIKTFIRRYLPQLSIASLALLFAIVYFWNAVFYVIRSGEAGVYYWKFFGGTATDRIYDEGYQLVWPWDDLFIYNIRVQEKKKIINVLTKEGMSIQLNISIRYQPERELVAVLHKNVGSDYLEKVVVPEVEAVVREVAGKFTVEDLYTTKHMIPKQIINDAIEQVVRNYIKIQDVIITDIILPQSIKKSIELKVEEKHLADAYEYKIKREEKERDRKLIEADGIKQYNEIINTSMSDRVIQWHGILATEKLSKSENAKVIVIGNGPHGLPVIMNAGNMK